MSDMCNFFNPYILAVLLAGILDIIANIALVYSQGFKNIYCGILSLVCIALAFSALAYAVRGIDLAVAYAMWGGLGILGTSLGGSLLFGQTIRPTAWLGIAVLIFGIILLHAA